MTTFDINCSQRGCVSSVDAAAAPKKCPVCNQPLLKGNVVEQKTPKASAPAPTPPPPPDAGGDDTAPSESEPSAQVTAHDTGTQP